MNKTVKVLLISYVTFVGAVMVAAVAVGVSSRKPKCKPGDAPPPYGPDCIKEGGA